LGLVILGYDTALNTVVDVIDKIRDTVQVQSTVFVVGKRHGIVLNAGIGAGAEEILIQKRI
jgi:6-phosphofructokinase 1